MKRQTPFLFFLLLALSMLLAGCFQQAGDAFQPVSVTIAPVDGPAQSAPTQEPLPLDSTSTSVSVDTAPLATSTQPPLAPTLPPTLPPPTVDTGSGGGLTSVDATPTFEVAITIISPTREIPPTATVAGAVIAPDAVTPTQETQFVTPSSPLGPVTQEAIIPLGSVSATPSGLITPTALGETGTDATPAAGGNTTTGSDNADCVYIVEGGDTLFRIAVRNNTTVDEIRKVNPGLDGDLIQPGQELTIPDCGVQQPDVSAPADQQATPVPEVPAGGTTYAVRSGDTLYTIAQRYGVTVQAIVDANQISNPNQLNVGQQLIIPPSPN
jgi:LysM repeat protein